MKGRIEINSERCKGCRYCIEACPSGIISLSGTFNKSGLFPAVAEYPERCTGCALCAHMCPEVAIEVYRRKTTGNKRRPAPRQKQR